MRVMLAFVVVLLFVSGCGAFVEIDRAIADWNHPERWQSSTTE